MIDLNRPRYFNALSELVGGDHNLTGGSTDGPMSKIGFTDGIKKPTESAVQTKLAELQAEYDANEYHRSRASEYPSITDVVVALAEKEEGDSTMWDDITAKRQAVKTKYKKG